MTSIKKAILVALSLALSACTTHGTFVVPPNTQLEVYKRPVTVENDGTVVTKPFFGRLLGCHQEGEFPIVCSKVTRS